MKLFRFPSLVVALLAAMGVPALAATITFQLNCAVTGGTACTSYGDWGTAVITTIPDSSWDKAGIQITLSDQTWKLLSYDFNYDDSKFGNSSPFSLASGKGVGVKENDKALQGSGNFGGFDLEVPKNGNLNVFGTYSDTLSLSGTDLVASDFYFPTDSGIYFGVHIGNYNGGDSIAVASKPNTAVPPTGTAVPETTSLLLLGTGLAGLGLAAWRKRK